MELTKQEIDVIKGLVGKELNHVKHDGEKLLVSNAPFLGKEALDEADLPFLKSIEDYKHFLQELLKKL